jgi:hypothetical protein
MIMKINHYDFLTTYQLDDRSSWYLSLKPEKMQRINTIVYSVCTSNSLALLYSKFESKEFKYLSNDINELCKIKLKHSEPIFIERKYNYEQKENIRD